MVDISVIIPFLNEEDNIPRLTGELDAFIKSNPKYSFEIIMVDDGSTDNSIALLKRSSLDAKVVRLSKNFGSHAAFRAGIQAAKGKACINIYADLQEPLECIPQFFEYIEKGHDIVWAKRERIETTLFDRFFTRFFAWLIRSFVNPEFPVAGLDLVMFNEKVRNELNKNIEANSSFTLQILSMGFNQVHVPYVKQERLAGASKWTISKKIKIIVDSFVAFSYMPIRMVTIIGIIMFMAGLVFSGYLVARKLIVDDLILGWPVLMSVLIMGFGITNISLGVIAEYVWRDLDVSRKRPVFIVDDIIQLGTENES